MPKQLSASIVIPAYNEEKYLRFTLLALKKQSFTDFEVIVVDNASTDNTAKVAKLFGARVVREDRKGVSYARNAGAEAANGKVLIFIDADTTASTDLVKAYVDAFKEKVVAATGPILPLEKTGKLMEAEYKAVSVFFVKSAIKLGRPSIIGSNFAVLADSFKKAGGFDVKLKTYEDWDLSMRLKKLGKIVYVDDAVAKTSARRIMKWGVLKYAKYHVGNVLRYNITKKPKENYEDIR